MIKKTIEDSIQREKNDTDNESMQKNERKVNVFQAVRLLDMPAATATMNPSTNSTVNSYFSLALSVAFEWRLQPEYALRVYTLVLAHSHIYYYFLNRVDVVGFFLARPLSHSLVFAYCAAHLFLSIFNPFQCIVVETSRRLD